MCCLNGNVHLIQFNNFFIQARGPTWLVLWNTKTVYHEKINIKASSSKLWLQRKSIDFLQKLNSMSFAVFALRPWYQCSRQLLGFSGSQRAPRTSRAHSPAAARRNPGPGCRVSDRGPQQRELRSGEKCAATHSAEAECTQISWPHHDQHLMMHFQLLPTIDR